MTSSGSEPPTAGAPSQGSEPEQITTEETSGSDNLLRFDSFPLGESDRSSDEDKKLLTEGLLTEDEKNRLSLKQENTRAALAIMLLLVFAMSIGASFVYIFVSRFFPKTLQCSSAVAISPAGSTPGLASGVNPSPTPPTPPPESGDSATPAPQAPIPTGAAFCSFDNSPEQLVTLILNSLTAIIGTALGFYFGAQAKEDFKASEQAKNAPTGQNQPPQS